MSALSTRERRGSDNASSITRQHLDFYPLGAKRLDTSTPMLSAAPVSPAERFSLLPIALKRWSSFASTKQ